MSTHAALFTVYTSAASTKSVHVLSFTFSSSSATWHKSVWCAKDFKTTSTHPVKQFSPALHGDTLEDREDRKQDVVKLGDSIVWSQPVLSTRGTIRTHPCRGRVSTWKLLSDLI